MFEVADVVNGDDDRHGAKQRRGVLYMQQVGRVLPQFHTEIRAQPDEGIARNISASEACREPWFRIRCRDISREFSGRV